MAFSANIQLFSSNPTSQVADLNGDEDDGMDETILPCDYNSAGVSGSSCYFVKCDVWEY